MRKVGYIEVDAGGAALHHLLNLQGVWTAAVHFNALKPSWIAGEGHESSNTVLFELRTHQPDSKRG